MDPSSADPAWQPDARTLWWASRQVPVEDLVAAMKNDVPLRTPVTAALPDETWEHFADAAYEVPWFTLLRDVPDPDDLDSPVSGT